MNKRSSVRVRFAPSPTGYLHIGNARTAIFNWLFARHNNGQFFLRIEDTDSERSKPEFLESILNSLRWLGIDWDREPIFQSKRKNIYLKMVQELLDSGNAYFCKCTSEFLETLRKKASSKGISFTYPGICRNLRLKGSIGSMPVRIKLPNSGNWLRYHDLIRGTVSFPREQMDDFIILRTDGSPTYNFVVTVDDSLMEISHVIRGEDHISNTPKQLALYQIFKFTPPKFAHLPMILSPTGGRLSKRDGAVSIQDWRRKGFLPQAVLNYLVRLGWSYGDQEIFSKDELIKYFSLDKVGKTGAAFDSSKLEWLNSHYLKNISNQELVEQIKQWSSDDFNQLTQAWQDQYLKKLLSLYAKRAKTLTEISRQLLKLSKDPNPSEIAQYKELLNIKNSAAIEKFYNQFERYHTSSELLSFAKQLCSEFQIKLPDLAQPLRLALTGSTQSPGIFELISILPVKITKKRIENLIKMSKQ